MGRDGVHRYLRRGVLISIHAPRVGRDHMGSPSAQMTSYFNPRAPCGARRARREKRKVQKNISIHAPRVGRDAPRDDAQRDNTYFNPRAPCGARLNYLDINGVDKNISIHAPRVGRDLRSENQRRHNPTISIHAPRVGRDSKFDDFTPSNLHKRYKRVLARPKNTREKGKIKQKLAYIHAFSAFLGCEGSGTFCALVLRTQYR